MEITSHYYALLAMCRICGVNKEAAQKIAYASQFVDDAKINNISFATTDSDDPLLEIINGCKVLVNIATCHTYTRVNTFNYQAMINNTAAFHFCPGCDGKRFTKKMRCKENSDFINSIIDEFINAEPEQFGMLMHIYADTFAHQGFSGILSKENDIRKLESGKAKKSFSERSVLFGKKLLKVITKKDFDDYFDKLMPAYGHGQAMHNPDVPYIQWSYEYDPSDDFKGLKFEKSNIDNIERYKRAFEKIREKIIQYLEANLQYNEDTPVQEKALDEFFEILKAPAHEGKKIIMWQNFLEANNFYDKGEAALKYSETEWLKEAFTDFSNSKYAERVVLNARTVKDFEKTSWFKFVKGVKKYKEIFHSKSKIYGLNIPI